MSTVSFPEIDTSYWNLDDKAWVSDRKVQWSKIEPMFKDGASKSKKGLGIIKKYFLKGEMPDFKALQDWNNTKRHLDLFCFLWLHPENDEDLLREFRNAYINSPLVLEEDVSVGIAEFLDYATIYACYDYDDDELLTVLHTSGNNRLYFRVILGDLTLISIPEEGRKNWSLKKPAVKFESKLISMSRWLCSIKATHLGDDCLYLYDDYLEYWYSSAPMNEDHFQNKKFKRKIPVCQKALYRIHHFDIEKEGDTCRTRFVHKMRKLLDERDFIPEFKQMWLDVKSRKIEVENAWKR